MSCPDIFHFLLIYLLWFSFPIILSWSGTQLSSTWLPLDLQSQCIPVLYLLWQGISPLILDRLSNLVTITWVRTWTSIGKHRISRNLFWFEMQVRVCLLRCERWHQNLSMFHTYGNKNFNLTKFRFTTVGPLQYNLILDVKIIAKGLICCMLEFSCFFSKSTHVQERKWINDFE